MNGARRIGLTGGIGSGKSTVASIWERRGACIVDADAISKSLTAPGGAALPEIARLFGADMVGATGLNRERMRQLVFVDDSARARLESLLHPLIGAEALRQAQAAGLTPVIFDIPLLAESPHWRARVDCILVVDCPRSVQVLRVVARSGWTEAAVERAIDSQSSRERRRSIADAVIHNDDTCTVDMLEVAVDKLWRHWIDAR